MCLNGLTAASRSLRRSLALAGLLALGGCAAARHTAAVVAPTRGDADLDALVRHHPGWAGVARYDQALARLDAAANRPTTGLESDSGLAVLPNVVTEPGQAPALDIAADRQRLAEVERVQVARLKQRQTQSRDRRIALNREVWQRQAQAQYDLALKGAQAAYLRQVQTLGLDREARRLNLTLQIKALQKIVTGWNNSVPPTPELNLAKTDLAKKQAESEALNQTVAQAAVQARADRDAADAQALAVRDAYIAGQSDQLAARLLAQDAQQTAALQARLTQQQAALLREEQAPPNQAVPAAGELGVQSLPSGPSPAVAASSAAAHSLRLSERLLQAQRTRWVAFIYDDTRAAALDVAGRHHWIVTFRRPAPGARDLTAPLAQELTTSVWKT